MFHQKETILYVRNKIYNAQLIREMQKRAVWTVTMPSYTHNLYFEQSLLLSGGFLVTDV
jgi:hypothetical protein